MPDIEPEVTEQNELPEHFSGPKSFDVEPAETPAVELFGSDRED